MRVLTMAVRNRKGETTMATIKKPTIDDAVALIHAYGAAAGTTKRTPAEADPRVVELARAYAALLQTVNMQAGRIAEIRETLSTVHDRLDEWPLDK